MPVRHKAAHAARTSWRPLTVAAAALAFIVAGAGGAVAHGIITSSDIQNGTIQQVDVGPAGVSGFAGPGDSEIAGESVTSNNLKDEGVRPYDLGNKFRADIVSELEGWEIVTSDPMDFGPGGFGWVQCPDGKHVVGGGYQLNTAADLSNGVSVATDAPYQEGDVFGEEPNTVAPEGTGWMVQPNKPVNVNPGDITVYAVCVDRDEKSPADFD